MSGSRDPLGRWKRGAATRTHSDTRSPATTEQVPSNPHAQRAHARARERHARRPAAVSRLWHQSASPEPARPDQLDPETEARWRCNRPGFEGGINFFDLWRARRRDEFEDA